MKMLLRQVGEGKLTFYGKLRKGDELQDFFETFATMVERIKERQKREVDELESAIEAARASGASEEAIAAVAGALGAAIADVSSPRWSFALGAALSLGSLALVPAFTGAARALHEGRELPP